MTSAPEFTQRNLKYGRPQELCQAVEDYRLSSPLDILGSIGGLLALLQGIHIFLFGRPLFWGLFGEIFYRTRLRIDGAQFDLCSQELSCLHLLGYLERRPLRAFDSGS